MRKATGPFVAAHANRAVLTAHRRGDRINCQGAALPDRSAIGQIVTADEFRRQDDDLGAVLVIDDQRRVPGCDFVALGLPARRPVFFSRT